MIFLVAQWSLLAVLVALVIARDGWRKGASYTLGCVTGSTVLVIPLWVGHSIAGTVGSWCATPIVVTAWLFGRSPLGIMNFVILQWFGVRIAWVFKIEDGWTSNPLDQHSGDAIAGMSAGSRSINLLRWVWPLTGWWSEYRWIARPGRRSP